jgi:hypothetical protein
MTKRQLIDEIITANHTAEPSFLAQFDDSDLREYLRHLRWARQPRLSGDLHRYEKYFKNLPGSSARRAAAAKTRVIEQPEETDTPAVPASRAPPAEVEDDVGFDDLTEVAEYRGREEDLIQEEVDEATLPLAAAEPAAADDRKPEEPSPFAKAEEPQQKEPDTESWLF